MYKVQQHRFIGKTMHDYCIVYFYLVTPLPVTVDNICAMKHIITLKFNRIMSGLPFQINLHDATQHMPCFIIISALSYREKIQSVTAGSAACLNET